MGQSYDDAALSLLAEAAGSPLGGILMPVLMIAVVYFLLLRPMSKQEKDRKKRIQTIKKGDKVVLTGGLLGRISNMDDQVAVVELADKVKVRVLRKEVMDLQENVLKADAAKKDEKSEKADKDEKDDKPEKSDKSDKSEKSAPDEEKAARA